MSRNELRTEFLVCMHNIALLHRHSPYFHLKFLTSLVSDAALKGNVIKASKVTGVIQGEANQKRWQRVNRVTGKAWGGLMLSVKVPTDDGKHMEYSTKEGVYEAVSLVIRARFQSALIAPCHQGTFFEDIGHLADGPVAQQILKGTYDYPADLDPATRLLFEEASATY